MEVEFDESKSQRNIELRGLSFELVAGFDFEGAIEVEQVVSGDQRYFALGHTGARLHALV